MKNDINRWRETVFALSKSNDKNFARAEKAEEKNKTLVEYFKELEVELAEAYLKLKELQERSEEVEG